MGREKAGMLKLRLAPFLNLRAETPQVSSHYRPEIDGLRAVAVIAVIVSHFHHPILPSGYLGVDIFFVISGYVITASLFRKQHYSLVHLLSGFYTRRIRRILPALIAFILVAAFLICLFNPNPGESLNTGMAALFGVSNVYLMQRTADYFAAPTQLNIFTHTWSLGVEEQFYIFYPLIAWFATAKTRSRRLLHATILLLVGVACMAAVSKLTLGSYFALIPGGLYNLTTFLPYVALALSIPAVGLFKPFGSGTRNLMLCLGGLSSVSLALFWFTYERDFVAAYYLMPSRFWELAAGCLLFLAAGTMRQSRLTFLSRIPASLIGGLLLLSFGLPLDRGRTATILVVFLTTFLIARLNGDSLAGKLLSHPWALKIGLASYSLYLWHWGVIALSRWTIGIHGWTVPLQILLIWALALASCRWVEQPFRYSARFRSVPHTLFSGMASLAASSMALVALSTNAHALSLDRRFPTEFGRQLATATFNTDRIENVVDRQKLLDSLTTTTTGSPLPRPRLYILGDSHAEQYVDALQRKLPERGVGAAIIGWRCGYISPLDIEPLTRQWMQGCEAFKQFVDSFVATQVEPGDIVLLAHRWKEKKVKHHQEAVLDELADRLQARRAQLVVIDDVPELEVVDPLFCQRRPWRPLPMDGCFRSSAEVNRDQRVFDGMAARLMARHRNVHYVQLRDLYCTGSLCGPYKGDTLLYRDNNHLRYEASLLGAERLVSRLRSLGGAPAEAAARQELPQATKDQRAAAP
jgi:peptidoglycan/LPS O-acetylase OafA/YrhL